LKTLGMAVQSMHETSSFAFQGESWEEHQQRLYRLVGVPNGYGASPPPRHPHGVYGHYHRWHWHSLLLQHRSIPPGVRFWTRLLYSRQLFDHKCLS
jgi:hypothetical protein